MGASHDVENRLELDLVLGTVPGEGGGRTCYIGNLPARAGGSHRVALALIPDMGNNSAAIGAMRLLQHFTSVADATWTDGAGGAGYLVVRGICDYCDEKKGDAWQRAAALAAAAYVRALLGSLPGPGKPEGPVVVVGSTRSAGGHGDAFNKGTGHGSKPLT